MGKIELTVDEQAAIEDLKKLGERWPDTLMIENDDEDTGDTLVMKEDPKNRGIFREVARVSGIRNGGIG